MDSLRRTVGRVPGPSIVMLHSGVASAFFAIALLGMIPNAVGAVLSTDSTNLVANSGFEQTEGNLPAGWETRTWSGDPQFFHDPRGGRDGTAAVRISSESGADASWSFRIRVRPNTRYRVTAWIKTADVGADGLGALINLHELQFEGKTEAIRGTRDWTCVSSEFETGSHDSLLVNCLFGGWGRATGTAWYDDIEVVELGSALDPASMTAVEKEEFFESRVLPILETHCFKCHGKGEKIRAELVLSNRDDLLKGGESGPAVDLESPHDSLLVSAINYESWEMPPDGQLPREDIETLIAWVEMGVPWKGPGYKPKSDTAAHRPPAVNEETRRWWSYQPVRPVPVPDVESPWIENDIDRFILNKLNEVGLVPNSRASREVLVRRAYYDLLGLPPTPEQVQSFVNDDRPDAWPRLIDQLLESPHYGEKWGRHWLDLVRYAESNSYERDGTKPFVWRYRDYVIRAFNDDKPYDQFVVEQLAGDELADRNADSLIATGYYRLGKWDDEPVDHEQAWFDDADDILATTGQTFLGMTINCARCHDHKIDPISQRDYYSMLAFIRNIQRYGVRGHDTVLRQSTRPLAPPEVQQRYEKELREYEQAVQENNAAIREIEEWVRKDFIPVEHEEFKYEMNRRPLVKKRIGATIDGREFTQADFDRYEQLFEQMMRLREDRPQPLELALCVTEQGATAPPTYVLIRGNPKSPSEEVQPAFPEVLSPPPPHIEPPADGLSTGRRLALARWIASPDNPLTARVMANRIWQHHMGRGIVRSASDFGFQGTPPTHPELLDWLAEQFVQHDWRLKPLHRMIMTSATYQMASTSRPEAVAVDPLNDSFWRFNMRRLTAEEVRDSILAVNGTLNLQKMFGPSIYPIIEKEVLHGQSRPGENWGNSSPEDRARRSIYIHVKRSLPVPILQSFDVADPDSPCPVRFNTVQPTQALGLLNSQFLNEQAASFAEFIRRQEPDDVRRQVALALRRATQREPRAEEIERGVKFMQEISAEPENRDVDPLRLFCVVALNLNEFLFLD